MKLTHTQSTITVEDVPTFTLLGGGTKNDKRAFVQIGPDEDEFGIFLWRAVPDETEEFAFASKAAVGKDGSGKVVSYRLSEMKESGGGKPTADDKTKTLSQSAVG